MRYVCFHLLCIYYTVIHPNWRTRFNCRELLHDWPYLSPRIYNSCTPWGPRNSYREPSSNVLSTVSRRGKETHPLELGSVQYFTIESDVAFSDHIENPSDNPST